MTLKIVYKKGETAAEVSFGFDFGNNGFGVTINDEVRTRRKLNYETWRR
jgi:hypothetical protein